MKPGFVKHVPWDPIEPEPLPEFSFFRRQSEEGNQYVLSSQVVANLFRNGSLETSMTKGHPSAVPKPRRLEDFEIDPGESEFATLFSSSHLFCRSFSQQARGWTNPARNATSAFQQGSSRYSILHMLHFALEET